jgi:hypothetical protein
MAITDLIDDGNDYYKDKVLPEWLRLTDAEVDVVRRLIELSSMSVHRDMKLYNLLRHQLEEYDARMKAKDPDYKPNMLHTGGGDAIDYYKDKVLPESLMLTDANVDAVRKQQSQDSRSDHCNNMMLFNFHQRQLDEYDFRMWAKDSNYKPKLWTQWGGFDANGPQQATPPSNSASAPSSAMSPLPSTISSPNTLSPDTAQNYDSQIANASGENTSDSSPEPSAAPNSPRFKS